MDKDELWRQTLLLLLENVDENDPKSVFLNLLTPFGLFGDQFILQAQNAQVESWVKNNYLPEMTDVLAAVSGQRLNIGIGVNQDPGAQQQPPAPQQEPDQVQQPEPVAQPGTPDVQTEPQPHDAEAPDWLNVRVSPADFNQGSNVAANTPAAESVVRHGISATQMQAGEAALFSKCTFDTFVVGKSNEFARSAAMNVAEQPGVAFNPLFIYGNSGLGKTHLLVAIANYALQNFPAMTTVYVSANGFLNDFVAATQHNQWATFNQKYHGADLLLVDDVQYLEGKDETINQLFTIFNEMTNQNKQVVLSADRAPKDIDMDERMRSRFVSGLLADVKAPDYETRLAIMRNYLSRIDQQKSFYGPVPDDVLSYLAEVSTSNIREMEGAITRIVSHMTLMKKQSIAVDEARELLHDFFPNPDDKQIDIDTIQSEVERFFNVTHEDIVSEKRSRGITHPRHIAIYLCRFLTEESLENIGKKFGGRDHTTVMYSVRKIEQDQKKNKVLFDQIDLLTNRIKEHK